MNSQTIIMCVVSLVLGMLLANMLKSVCGCKVVEGLFDDYVPRNEWGNDDGATYCKNKCMYLDFTEFEKLPICTGRVPNCTNAPGYTTDKGSLGESTIFF